MAKYSKALTDKICRLISQANTIESICKVVNISQQTFYRWRHEKSEFNENIKRALEIRDFTGKSLAIHTIFNAMKEGTWQAAAWWLERNFPEEFGKHRVIINKSDNYDMDSARKELEHILSRKGLILNKDLF